MRLLLSLHCSSAQSSFMSPRISLSWGASSPPARQKTPGTAHAAPIEPRTPPHAEPSPQSRLEPLTADCKSAPGL